jgi:hypothetical protein
MSENAQCVPAPIGAADDRHIRGAMDVNRLMRLRHMLVLREDVRVITCTQLIVTNVSFQRPVFRDTVRSSDAPVHQRSRRHFSIILATDQAFKLFNIAARLQPLSRIRRSLSRNGYVATPQVPVHLSDISATSSSRPQHCAGAAVVGGTGVHLNALGLVAYHSSIAHAETDTPQTDPLAVGERLNGVGCSAAACLNYSTSHLRSCSAVRPSILRCRRFPGTA